jgi:hypothetical protein
MDHSWADMVKSNNSVKSNSGKIIISDSKLKKKVAVNKTWGGFTLSHEAKEKLFSIKNKIDFNIDNNIFRDDDDLINVIMELGEEKASGDVYGIKMKIKILSFDFDPETEVFIIHLNDGLEDVIIRNKYNNSGFIINDNGSRQKLDQKSI